MPVSVFGDELAVVNNLWCLQVTGAAKPSCRSTAAPKGVTVTLYQQSNQIEDVNSDDSGRFVYRNIFPGKIGVGTLWGTTVQA